MTERNLAGAGFYCWRGLHRWRGLFAGAGLQPVPTGTLQNVTGNTPAPARVKKQKIHNQISARAASPRRLAV
jgi:hypothetical protein